MRAREFLYINVRIVQAANPSVTQSNRTITSELWSGRKDRVSQQSAIFGALSIYFGIVNVWMRIYALWWVMCMCGEEPIGGTSRRKRKVICPGARVSAIIAFGERTSERRRSLWVLRTARTPRRADPNVCAHGFGRVRRAILNQYIASRTHASDGVIHANTMRRKQR